mmetsp:Transcript_20615/g.45424  ORF Transcript_20615/g.45424 Transcript_20615/m.45424 type:complete len:93 (-) Transcript_20615:63-341(-)
MCRDGSCPGWWIATHHYKGETGGRRGCGPNTKRSENTQEWRYSTPSPSANQRPHPIWKLPYCEVVLGRQACQTAEELQDDSKWEVHIGRSRF